VGYPVRLVSNATSRSGANDRLPAGSREAAQSARENEDQLRDLMVRYQQGDAAAVDTLVTNLSPALLRFCWGPAMSHSDAEDLLQDCWLRIHRARHTYLPSEPLLPWIFAVARHTRLDAHRRRRRLGSREVLVDGMPEPSDATPAPGSDVMELVNRLPDGQRVLWGDRILNGSIARIQDLTYSSGRGRE
jgi:sigma-70-like protein